MSVPTTTARSQRINLRASERQESLLRQAAAAADTSLTEFILGSAVAHAEKVLADRTSFVASHEQYEEFVRLLDEPVPTEKLAALFARKPVFDMSFTIDD